MIRVRKNANQLTVDERDRFVAAFAQLNDNGMGEFRAFRDMHTAESDPEAHGGPGFLPWHRAYLLDLERELQAIDSSVSLPYWRFDEPAPNLFHPDFIGTSDFFGSVEFSPSNPLQFWTTDGVLGVSRFPFFNTSSSAANVISEEDTFLLGLEDPFDDIHEYRDFRDMEFNPHGSAHVSFNGFIDNIHTAAKYPLFFLLHCNVDRLWAKWQWLNHRFDQTNQHSYQLDPVPHRVGHNLADTMWPWNEITISPRPPTAPGGSLADSDIVQAPGPRPEVHQMIDFQARFIAGGQLGFDYDDVPFDRS